MILKLPENGSGFCRMTKIILAGEIPQPGEDLLVEKHVFLGDLLMSEEPSFLTM